MEYYTLSGIGPFTHKQAITLVKIIAWASKHEDCDVTRGEAMNLCTAIQYLSSTRPKEDGVDLRKYYGLFESTWERGDKR